MSTEGGTLRVLVADDHPVFRRGVVALIRDELGPCEVAETGDGPATLEQIRLREWDLVLLDLSMPKGDPLEMVEAIRAHAPKVPLLVLSATEEGELAVRLLREGIDGYVNKSRSADCLVEAIHRVRLGGRYIGPELAERMARQLDERVDQVPHERLSNREFQVLCRLGRGQSVTEIGKALGLSAKTVSTYRTRLLEKMRLQTNADIVRYVLEHDLSPNERLA